MKPKINIPNRGKSNPPRGKNQQISFALEEETKIMEQKLKELKDVMAIEQAKRAELGTLNESGSRWKTGNDKVPLKNYAKVVLENKNKYTQANNQNKNTKENVLSVTNSGNFVPSDRIQRNQSETSKASQVDFRNTSNSFKDINEEYGNSVKPILTNQAQKVIKQNFVTIQKKDDQDRPISSSSTSSNKKVTPTPSFEFKPKLKVENSIENNLKKALKLQRSSTNEVDIFLKEIGLSQYAEIFKENGFDDMEILLDMTTKHLVDMKIPSGHQIKIMKSLEKIKQNTMPNQPKLSDITLPLSNTSTIIAASKSTDTFASSSKKLLKDHADLNQFTSNAFIKVDNGNNQNKIKNSDNLGEGEFNEAESHNYFLEALMAFRNSKNPNNQDTDSINSNNLSNNNISEIKTKTVRFVDDIQDNRNTKQENQDNKEPGYFSSRFNKKPSKKSFLFSGDNAWNMDLYPSNKDSETIIEPADVERMKCIKKSCWNCYGLFEENRGFKYNDKMFCSKNCLKKLKNANSVKCNNKSCNKEMTKQDCLLIEGFWYCSEKCGLSKSIYDDDNNDENKQQNQNNNIKSEFILEENRDSDNQNNLSENIFDIDIDEEEDINNLFSLEKLEQKYRIENIKPENINKNQKEITETMIDSKGFEKNEKVIGKVNRRVTTIRKNKKDPLNSSSLAS